MLNNTLNCLAFVSACTHAGEIMQINGMYLYVSTGKRTPVLRLLVICETKPRIFVSKIQICILGIIQAPFDFLKHLSITSILSGHLD